LVDVARGDHGGHLGHCSVNRVILRSPSVPPAIAVCGRFAPHSAVWQPFEGILTG